MSSHIFFLKCQYDSKCCCYCCCSKRKYDVSSYELGIDKMQCNFMYTLIHSFLLYSMCHLYYPICAYRVSQPYEMSYIVGNYPAYITWLSRVRGYTRHKLTNDYHSNRTMQFKSHRCVFRLMQFCVSFRSFHWNKLLERINFHLILLTMRH